MRGPEPRPAWRALQAHQAAVAGLHLRALLAGDPGRAARMTAQAAGLTLDFSRHRVTDETVRLLVRLAGESGLAGRIAAMFAGERINVTEDRAAMHVALRAPRGTVLRVDGVDVVPAVHAVLDRMAAIAEAVRGGTWTGHTGRRIRAVVNIGIGGSDLGPAMAYEALRPYADPGLAVRFVSNVDGRDLLEALRGLDPAETLFVVVSKTFTTTETLANANSARAWCVRGLGDERAVARHFLAVSSNLRAVAEFGIDPANALEVWDWVGGRYSMDSAVGLSTMIAVGPERFREMLSGFHAMDEHFRTAPFERNLPVLMGLLAVWYADFFGAGTAAVIPYAHDLRRFPAYLQQLAMESNGKHVTLEGATVPWPTAPVVWGEPGTNAQHSFFQLLHQGTRLVPCDFVVLLEPVEPLGRHHALLVANALAQAEALAAGRSAAEARAEGAPARLAPHRTFEGNRPSSIVAADRLAPATLGALVALYEHSVFTQGVLWDVDSFDQWGVELGKVLAKRIVAELESDEGPGPGHDASTDAWIRRYRERRAAPAGAGRPGDGPTAGRAAGAGTGGRGEGRSS